MSPTKLDAIYALAGFKISSLADGSIIYPDGQTPPTEEEIQKKLTELLSAEPMRLLREERNRILTETDWTQSRDVTLSKDTELKTYRQALRDITKTTEPKLDENGNLINIVWPKKP
jgi:hypothetical protein